MKPEATRPQAAGIDELIQKHRVLITCGTGGVGKTTLSSAIAIRAAIAGRKVAVITIDPAKRLATSLGLSTLGDEPHDLTAELKKACAAQGLEARGTLAALMPDTRKTFEHFVRAMAPTPQIAERVFANSIFQIFAKEFSGTNEYMAMERLFTLSRSSQYDFVVLDTPPSRNTLAFLEAPRRLSEFFEDRIMKWLIVPANKLVAIGMKTALGMLEKLTGSGFMSDLLEFATTLFEVRAKFQRNLEQVMTLLRHQSTGFLLVAAASPETGPEAAHFIASVERHGLRFIGLALNRTLGYLKVSEPEKEALDLLAALQRQERTAIESLKKALPLQGSTPQLLLPELARDVHSLDDLILVSQALEPTA